MVDVALNELCADASDPHGLLDAAPYPNARSTRLVVRSRKRGRSVNVCVSMPWTSKRDGFRESLSVDASSDVLSGLGRDQG